MVIKGTSRHGVTMRWWTGHRTRHAGMASIDGAANGGGTAGKEANGAGTAGMGLNGVRGAGERAMT